ncbi:hypothetical protein [Spongiactinospora sp. TRM90649]|uniref:hypothetical protein n=1 Tax=Spongiactinospora sp. TRM90649 TaxID=3031114 RepID=UPI0023F9F8F7|nr:hypothetical protein [Spongiactinospora sp. TRM90649]MDF5755552.1 hypothetical protein [Spongiactinospora sp. TRM90649]
MSDEIRDNRKSGARLTANVIAGLGAAFFVINGLWSFFWPESFYSTIATYPPFSLHLFHDLGAFQLGIGASLAGALLWRDVLFVGLFGGVVGAVVHAISHVMDRDLGGRPGDPWTVGAVAFILLVGMAARLRFRKIHIR